jgi:hypothetical protein
MDLSTERQINGRIDPSLIPQSRNLHAECGSVFSLQQHRSLVSSMRFLGRRHQFLRIEGFSFLPYSQCDG